MEQTDNKPFKDSALALQAIETFLRSRTHSNPVTSREVYQALGTQTKNEKQCENAVRRMYEKKLLLKIREGRNVRYWWNTNAPTKERVRTDTTRSATPATPVQVKENPRNMPEIVVTKTSVTIISDRIKITVEL